MQSELTKRIKKSNQYINKLFEFHIDNLYFHINWYMDMEGNLDPDKNIEFYIWTKFPQQAILLT